MFIVEVAIKPGTGETVVRAYSDQEFIIPLILQSISFILSVNEWLIESLVEVLV